MCRCTRGREGARARHGDPARPRVAGTGLGVRGGPHIPVHPWARPFCARCPPGSTWSEDAPAALCHPAWAEGCATVPWGHRVPGRNGGVTAPLGGGTHGPCTCMGTTPGTLCTRSPAQPHRNLCAHTHGTRILCARRHTHVHIPCTQRHTRSCNSPAHTHTCTPSAHADTHVHIPCAQTPPLQAPCMHLLCAHPPHTSPNPLHQQPQNIPSTGAHVHGSPCSCVPMSLYPHVPMSLFSCVPVPPCPCVPISLCSCAPCSCAPLSPCPRVPTL